MARKGIVTVETGTNQLPKEMISTYDETCFMPSLEQR
jgi:hypothetical protein